MATYITVGGVRMADDPGYRVILDRISHAVPFYQSYLKNAAVMGAHVINNPLWQLAEDKFLGVAMAESLGLRVPRTVLLPNREHVAGIVPESLRNRADPVDWAGAMAWIGFPLIMRPNWGAGTRTAFLVHTPEELMARWDHSGTEQYILQEWLTGAHYVHCLVVGDHALPIIRPLRHTPAGTDAGGDDWELAARVADTAARLSAALGYGMNAVEFAVLNGDVMITDWLNHCPPIDPNGLTTAEFEWAVGRTAELLTRLADTPTVPTYRWDGLLTQAG
jgi:glutathione synthase/RimK-type ligase-like ATP-grasp enzyme